MKTHDLQVSMDLAHFLILQVIFQPSLSVLFTVEAERNMYRAESGKDVVMGCRFEPTPSNPNDLQVTWHWIQSGYDREVYSMKNGKGRSQSPEYQGRVQILADKQRDGWAKLKLSSLRISDSGTYQCSVQTTEGADYKTFTLSVVAPYKAVTKHIEKIAERDDLELTCQSEGYPESAVVWQDGRLQRLKSNSTAVLTRDQLFKVTSRIRISSSDTNNYTCTFENDGRSATFHIPDEIPTPQEKHDALIVILSIGVVMAVSVTAVLMYHRRKGSNTSNTRTLGVEGHNRLFSAVACQQVNKGNDEERTIINAGCTEENLGVFLKTHYSDLKEVRRSWYAFSVEELLPRLQNNEGQGVDLQALIPEVGGSVFLEGPPESGKTALAHILISSWSEGPSDLLDLGNLPLLVYVDCSTAKGDLFQEILSQRGITEKISTEDKLRTMLTMSGDAMLLLDGYKEGNNVFDVSLKRFISERGRCRVLVMACPGYCTMLKEKFGTRGVLKLQAQTVNSCDQQTH